MSHIDKLFSQHPDTAKETLKILYNKYPEKVKQAIHRASLGNHLDEDMMHEALAHTVRYDGRKAPFWTPMEFRELLTKNNINLMYEKYNEYDLSYIAQYFYADLKSLGQDPMTFVRIAEDILHDVDNPKACETAYMLACYKINEEED